jgi:16S rRNA (guanine1207-N2)-methyltransferase
MANQYFENNENLKSEIKKISYFYKGTEVFFFSDNGVFSKGGIDFGSNLLLKNVSLKNVTSVLDVGCGYGTIGVTIAKLNQNINVTMVDVNKRAIMLCETAIKENKIENAKVFESNIYENVDQTFDLVISNPPIRAGKQVVHTIILDAYKHLNDGGSMYCVIQKKQGAPSAISALEEVYKTVEIVTKDKGYYIIRAIK